MDPARKPIRVNRYFFIKKSCPDIHKLKFTSNTKLSSRSIEEWSALINLKNRTDFVIKAAHKSGATIICRIELYQKEAIFGPDFLHERQQRPNPRQFKSCQRHHSRTLNQKRTTNHPKSHHHYSYYLMHLIKT